MRPIQETGASHDADAEGTPADSAFEGETVRTSEHRVACDGGAGMGHPRVWLNLGEEGRIACPYCSRVFVLEGSYHDGDDADGDA